MKLRVLVTCAILAMAQGVLIAQINGDVLGAHDLGPSGQSPVKAAGALGCTFCHAPHGGVGGATPLWNQTLPKSAHTAYKSSTFTATKNQGNSQPPIGQSSSLCLSCHDGSIATVAPGQTVAYGTITMTGKMNDTDKFAANLHGSHPFSLVLPLKDASHLASSLVASKKTADPLGKVQMVGGNVECDSCHDPHVQNIDKVSLNFLVRDSSSGRMCLACHDPNRVMPGQKNSLAGWPSSIHALAPNKTAGQVNVGIYSTVGANACQSCHQTHNAPSPTQLMRSPNPAIANVSDSTTQDCLTCHSNTSNLGAPDVYSEFLKAGTGAGSSIGTAHLLPTGPNVHDAAEPALLQNNRHAACVDCHSPHAAQKVSSFTDAPLIRVSQAVTLAGAVGISASDGTTPLTPAVNQYENCLRCHGKSIGKQVLTAFGYLPLRIVTNGDPLNVIAEFTSPTSSHPVMHSRNSTLPQPSLMLNMLNRDGNSTGRLMGSGAWIFCTDCHNSDDNREIGGAGPIGPHGSKWAHILERRYEISQAVTPGGTIGNLFQSQITAVGWQSPGPYALCGKCHDLTNILGNNSFSQHASHLNAGFSCSVCHTAHGMAGTSANLSGTRLVNFDANVVAKYNGAEISYNQATHTCTLTCHNYNHDSNSGVSQVQSHHAH